MTTPLQPIEVLLVEDDPGDELMTREAFEENRIGNRLHVARDGEEALDFLYQRGEHAEAPRMDLILLDLNLPKYDGRQVLEQIRSDPELTHTPVVILTTSSAEEDIMSSYKLTLYSGGVAVKTWNTKGQVESESRSDGYDFVDISTGQDRRSGRDRRHRATSLKEQP